MNDKLIADTIAGFGSKVIELESRCDALEAMLCALAKKNGWPDAKVAQAIQQMKEASYQKRLERIESHNPAVAAALDRRDVLPDLPDGLL